MRNLFNAYNLTAIILGDFNAYRTLSEADSTDDSGQLPEEVIVEQNLVVRNTGAGTFVRLSGEVSPL